LHAVEDGDHDRLGHLVIVTRSADGSKDTPSTIPAIAGIAGSGGSAAERIVDVPDVTAVRRSGRSAPNPGTAGP
jgi:hypothetical protein